MSSWRDATGWVDSEVEGMSLVREHGHGNVFFTHVEIGALNREGIASAKQEILDLGACPETLKIHERGGDQGPIMTGFGVRSTARKSGAKPGA